MEPKEHLVFENLINRNGAQSTFKNVKDVIGTLCSYKDGSVSQEDEVNITTWDGLFKKAQNDMNLDNLCKQLLESFGSIAIVLADLFTKGFGISKNDEDDGSKADKSKDGEGTGMGDGEEVKDVSDQKEDEEQLRGTNKKVYVGIGFHPLDFGVQSYD